MAIPVIEETPICQMSQVGMGVNEPQHDKTNTVDVHSAKTQISLGIRTV
ncbi:MAG: hypothetical protein AB2693_27900 [Candidatus Thiodiazotropha sp.]